MSNRYVRDWQALALNHPPYFRQREPVAQQMGAMVSCSPVMV